MSRLIPMLPVRSIGDSVAFYEKPGFKVEQRNDSWGWAMLVFGDCRIMVDRSINLHPAATGCGSARTSRFPPARPELPRRSR